jgi:putative membrane protein
MKSCVRIAVLAVVVGGWMALVRADEDRQQPVSDQVFVRLASAAGLAEVNLGTQAAKQAENERVKEFARRMVDDHTRANHELLKLADQKRIAPAQAMDQKHRALADRMAALRGPEFDREYMRHMVHDHEQAVGLVQSEAKNGKDADLKEFASKTLPTLKEHLKMAKDLADREGGGRTRSGGASPADK